MFAVLILSFTFRIVTLYLICGLQISSHIPYVAFSVCWWFYEWKGKSPWKGHIYVYMSVPQNLWLLPKRLVPRLSCSDSQQGLHSPVPQDYSKQRQFLNSFPFKTTQSEKEKKKYQSPSFFLKWFYLCTLKVAASGPSF